jgi:hypothetical protein
MHVAVAVLRVPEGLDYAGIIADFDCSDLSNKRKNKKSKKRSGIDNPMFLPDEKPSTTEYGIKSI